MLPTDIKIKTGKNSGWEIRKAEFSCKFCWWDGERFPFLNFFSFLCMWTFKLQSSLCQLLSFQRLLELGSPCVMSFAAELCCIEGCWKSRPGTEIQGCEEHSYLVWPCSWVQNLDENEMWAPENCPKAWKHLPGHGSPGWGSAPVTRHPFPMMQTERTLISDWQTVTGTSPRLPVQAASFCSLAVDSVSSKESYVPPT